MPHHQLPFTKPLGSPLSLSHSHDHSDHQPHAPITPVNCTGITYLAHATPTPPAAHAQQLFVCPSRILRPSTRSRKPMKAPARSPQRSPRTTFTSVSNVRTHAPLPAYGPAWQCRCCPIISPLKFFDLPYVAPFFRCWLFTGHVLTQRRAQWTQDLDYRPGSA